METTESKTPETARIVERVVVRDTRDITAQFTVLAICLWMAGFIIGCVLIALAINDKLKVLET